MGNPRQQGDSAKKSHKRHMEKHHAGYPIKGYVWGAVYCFHYYDLHGKLDSYKAHIILN